MKESKTVSGAMTAWGEDKLIEATFMKALDESRKEGVLNHPVTKQEAMVFKNIAFEFYNLGYQAAKA